MQSGLCDLNIVANDITPPLLPASQNRPPKRLFAEVEEDTGEEPNSDELYGWIEEDEVAAEGLLIDDEPINDPNTSVGNRLDVVAEGHIKKVAKTAG